MQQLSKTDQHQQVIQAAISVFPSRTTTNLKALQENYPVINAFLPFWEQQRMPSQAEREALPMPA